MTDRENMPPLPPLPQPGMRRAHWTEQDVPAFTAGEMRDALRAYGQACWNAAIEAAAKAAEPKAPRGCDCERCDCGNQGDAEWVYAWDTQTALASAIRSMKEPE